MSVWRRAAALAVGVTLIATNAVTGIQLARPEQADADAAVYRYSSRWPQPTWHLSEPRGVAVDKAGNVYVADTGNDRIQKYSAAGVLVGGWGGDGSSDGRFNGPMGVAVDPSGSYVYVADTGNHRIQKFTSSGQFMSKWGKSGGPDFTGTGPSEFNSPEGIAVDGSGSIYVADTNNARIQKFSADGAFSRSWGRPGSDDGQFLLPCGVGIGPDGSVYVVDRDRTNCNVQRFDAEGRFISKWGEYTLIPAEGKFKYPYSVAADAAGSVYVTEWNNRVQKFTASGLFVSAWGVTGSGDSDVSKTGLPKSSAPMFDKPTGVAAFQASGTAHILVCDTGNDRVREFDSNGTALGVRGSYGVHPGRFNSLGGLAITPTGDVVAADTGNHRVQVFGSSGTFSAWVPAAGLYPYPDDRNAYFKNPAGVATDPSGNLYVVETGNDRVQKLTPSLSYVTKWGATGTGDGFFRKPAGVAAGRVSGVTRVYVADTENDRVQVFDDSGTFVGKFGTFGSGPGNLSRPTGVAVDTAGHVYVADTGNHRIQKFSSGGAYLDQWGSFGSDPGQFKSPSGICVDARGKVFVADTDNNRVEVFSAAGTFISAFGAAGPEAGQLTRPRGVVTSASGFVYVADTGNHRVEVFAPPITITIAGVSDGGAYNSSVTPEVQFVGTGLVASGLTLNGVPWTEATISAAGSYVLRAWARDLAGAEVSKSVSFKIDYTPPLTSSDTKSAYADSAVIALSATDDLSGVAKTFAKLDNLPEVETRSVTVTSFGVHTLQFWSQDKAGNLEQRRSVMFSVSDTKPPSTTSDARAAYAESATIRLTATDTQSAVEHTYMAVDGAAAWEGTTTVVAGYGTHTLEFFSVDSAGNREATHTVMFSILRGAKLVLSISASTVNYPGPVVLRGVLRNLSAKPMPGGQVFVWRSMNGSAYVRYRTLTSSTGVYSFTDRPDVNASYRMTSVTDETYASTASNVKVIKVRAAVSRPSTPSGMVRARIYRVLGRIAPLHRAPLTLFWQHLEGRRWVSRGKTIAASSAGSAIYSGRVTLRLSGRWRVRALHTDAGHVPSYSAFRYFTVR